MQKQQNLKCSTWGVKKTEACNEGKAWALCYLINKIYARNFASENKMIFQVYENNNWS